MLRKLRFKKEQTAAKWRTRSSSQQQSQEHYRRRSATDPGRRRSGSKRGSESAGESFATTLRDAWSAECKAVARWDFRSDNASDLQFKRGDCITVVTRTGSQFDWWEGTLDERTGIFPANYVQLVTTDVDLFDYFGS